MCVVSHVGFDSMCCYFLSLCHVLVCCKMRCYVLGYNTLRVVSCVVLRRLHLHVFTPGNSRECRRFLVWWRCAVLVV